MILIYRLIALIKLNCLLRKKHCLLILVVSLKRALKILMHYGWLAREWFGPKLISKHLYAGRTFLHEPKRLAKIYERASTSIHLA